KQVGRPPREIARALREPVPVAPPFAAVEELSGFVNVRLDEKWLATQVDEIVRAGTDFGRSMALAGKRLQVEFVSANPTGPLTVANARGGPLGDVLSSVLEFAGATVEREYYVEDTGTQFDTFGRSIAIRYRQLHGEEIEIPADAYPADYVKDIAYHVQSLRERRFDKKIDIWGSNTHYHLIQMRAAMQALGLLEKFEVVLYQYVRFLHEGVLKRMGRRTGQFLLLEEVIEAVGKDATRYFFLQSSADRQLDFDLELAVQQSNENPVYYVQYAHARIASILRT